MKNLALCLALLLPILGYAQGGPVADPNVALDAAALELAKAAIQAHGGEKLRSMKTLVMRGSAEVSGSPSQVFSAGFVTVLAGERYYLEITNPLQPLKQVNDGTGTTSSLPGFQLPPVNRIGLPMLQRAEDPGFKVSALPEKLKKKKGFRVTAPDGYVCDFIIDEKTGAVKSYEAEFDLGGRAVTTSVEIDTLKEVEGVKIPEKYSQRLELGFLTVYVNFKTKELLVNSPVEDSVFSLGSE